MTPIPTWPQASAARTDSKPAAHHTARAPAPVMHGATEAQPQVPPILDRLKALRCLAAVAMHGSTVRAAEALFISQPAVTRTVLEFERCCGVALFDRGGRGMVPTTIGLRAARRAQALLDHLACGAAAAVALAAPDERRTSAAHRFSGAVSAVALQALIAMSHSRSEAQAAAQLGISQPAVNRALRGLEHLAGVPLMRRSLRGTQLTESGELLLQHVKLACAEARGIESDLAAWRGEVRGRVVIGALPLSAAQLLPQAIEAVRRLRPEIEITVIDGSFDSLYRQLREADIDIMVGALRAPTPDVRQDVLFEEPLAVTARVGHPCFERDELTLADLADWEWILPLHCAPAITALRHAFACAGVPPPVSALHSNNAALTDAMLRGSDRLALTSRGQALHDERIGRARRVPVELPGTDRPIGVAIRKMGEPSPDLAVILDALRESAAAITSN